MTDPSNRRKLAAILSADVVGYSRLMAADEAATVETLKCYRNIISRLVVRRGGRVVNAPGDALLAEFPSAVEAVQAAVEIQKSLEGHNVDLEPDRRMRFRIGVNLGDVIEETDGTIYGDGVNIAARMEALAEGGGICISSAVYDAVEGKLSFGFDFLGERQVKNSSKPVRVYCVCAEPRSISRRSALAKIDWKQSPMLAAALLLIIAASFSWLKARNSAPAQLDKPSEAAASSHIRSERHNRPADDLFAVQNDVVQEIAATSDRSQSPPKARSGITKPSIAVLSFENLSADPEQGYLADGFTQELITEFARNGELAVIAQHTSASLRGKDRKAGDVARDLGVRYVLEGSLRRMGDTLRLTARLLDGATGQHMWAERYDIRAADIVATQDQIVRRVAGSFFAKLRDTEETGTLRHPPESLDVYELTMRGAALKHQFTAEGFRAGRAALKRAIELEKDYAPAYAFLGYLDAIDSTANFTGEKGFDDLDAAIALLRTAIRLDPSMAYAYQGMSHALAMKRDPLAALEYAKKAVALGPSDADNLLMLGRELASNGRYMDAIPPGEQAFLLNPVPPVYYYGLYARSLYGARRYEEAAKLTDVCVQRNSYQRTCRLVRIAALAELGRKDEAQAVMGDFLGNAPGFNLNNASLIIGYWGDPSTQDRFLSRLNEAGLPSTETAANTP